MLPSPNACCSPATRGVLHPDATLAARLRDAAPRARTGALVTVTGEQLGEEAQHAAEAAEGTAAVGALGLS